MTSEDRNIATIKLGPALQEMHFKDETPPDDVECKTYTRYLDDETTVPSSPVKTETMTKGDSTFEDVLNLAGSNGFWNHGLFILIYLGAIPSAFEVLSYQFLGYTPEYWCHIQELHDANWTSQQIIDFAIPRKSDGKLDGCLQRDYNYSLAVSLGYEEAKENLDIITNVVNGTVSCPKRDFNHTQYKSTVVTDFDLVCDQRWLYSTTSSVIQIGMLIASLIVGYATDLFGKRRFIIVCHIFHLLSGVLAAMSPSVGMYLFSKCLQSVFRMCTGISKFALVMELSSNSLRSYIGSAVGIPWALGQMLLPGIAYYIREWKYLQLILSSPFLYTISYYWFLPESPRWLILRGRYEEAVKVLKTIAYWNKRTLPSDEKLLEMVKSIAIKESGGEQGSEGLVSRGLNQLKELFQTKVKIVRTFVLFFCWFTTAFTYYGISLISVHIGSSEYWYMFFGGLVEIPSAILLWLFIHYVGRRLTLIGCFVMFGASVLCSLVVGDSLIWKMMLSLSGKFAISSAFTLIYLFVIEINTTKSRTLALGLSSVVGRFGSISSPYVNDLIGKTNPRAPAIAFGVFSCIAAISVCILPETRKAILPESRTDVEKIGSGAKGKGSNPTEETNGL